MIQRRKPHNVILPLMTGDGFAPATKTCLEVFEHNIMVDIDEAKSCGLPQGLIVAILHAHALQQTQDLLE